MAPSGGAIARTHSLQFCAYAALSASGQVVALNVQDLGAPASFAGIVGAAHGAASVMSEALFGRLGDRIDRRRLLVTGFAAAMVAYLLQAFATTPEMYLVSRFLVGLAAGMIPATLAAYVFEIKRPLGAFTSNNALGWLVGAVLVVVAGFLAVYSFSHPVLESVRSLVMAKGPFVPLFVASAVLCAGAWVLARRLPSMRVRIDVPLMPWKTVKANAHVYGSVLLRHVGASAVWITFPLYLKSIGGGLASLGLLHVVNMLSQITLFRLSDRVGWLRNPRRLVMAGLALSGLAFIGYMFAKNPWQLIPSQVLIGVGFSALWLGSLREVLEHNVERSTATGLLNASLSLSNVAGPLLGGLIVASFGFHGVLAFGTMTTALGLLVFVLMVRAAGPRSPIKADAGAPPGDVAV